MEVNQMAGTVIARMTWTVFRIPLRRAMIFALGTITDAEHVLLEIEDSDGVRGYAEAIPRPTIHGELTSTIQAVLTEFESSIVGQPVADRIRVMTKLDALVGNSTAKAAVDMAWTDIQCRRAQVSCHEIFGNYATAVDVTVGIGLMEPAEVAQVAASYQDMHGIRSFVVKVVGDVDSDVRRLRELRRAVSAHTFIYVDANRAYRLSEVQRFARGAAELGISWIEEPTAPGAAGRSQGPLSGLVVIGDESCIEFAQITERVHSGVVQCLALKLGRSGYIRAEAMRGFCEVSGVDIMMSTPGETSIGTLHSLAFGAARRSTSCLPGVYGYFLGLADDLLVEPLRVQDGRLHVRDVTGSGIEIDTDKLAHYSMA
jgi:L-Ala-D/L-Glu epimerase